MKVFTLANKYILEGVLVEKSFKYELPCIQIGEFGFGKKNTFLMLSGAEEGSIMKNCEITETTKGRIKILAGRHTTNKKALVVLRSQVTKYGGNVHSGKFVSENKYKSFPGRILARGIVSEGEFKGDQLIAVVNKGDIFRVAYTSKDGMAEFNYKFDGEKIVIVSAHIK